MGRRGETTAVCLLGSITKKDCQRMDALKYIAIGSGVFRLPSVGFRLTHRGITVVGNTARRIGGRIETLTRVREIGTQTSLQLQLRDDSILCETSTDDAGILRLRLRILQVADRVTHLTIIDIHAGGVGLIVVRAVSIVDRCIRSVGDGSKPVVGSKHAVHVLLSCHFIVSSIGIHTDEQVLEDIALIVDAPGIALKSSIENDTILTLITETGAVARHLITAHGRELVLLLETCL